MRSIDIVVMGKFEQDNYIDNGPEDIEWQVIDVKDGTALLISRYALTSMKYHHSDNSPTWELCDTRTWLNGEFFDSVFTEDEKNLIVETNVDNSANQSGNQVGNGADTVDRLFLLSYAEIAKYFPELEDRICMPTEYALSKGAVQDAKRGSTNWWMRSPGRNLVYTGCVLSDGVIGSSNAVAEMHMISLGNAIRPAMWVSTDGGGVYD